jgi:hypothetical protein
LLYPFAFQSAVNLWEISKENLCILRENAIFAGMKWLRKAWYLYVDGFRSMTLGRTLWIVILVKLFIIFIVLKLCFFPNYIKEHAREGDEAEFVSSQILNYLIDSSL